MQPLMYLYLRYISKVSSPTQTRRMPWRKWREIKQQLIGRPDVAATYFLSLFPVFNSVYLQTRVLDEAKFRYFSLPYAVFWKKLFGLHTSG